LERFTDPWALIGYAAAGLFFAQRVFDALEYFGKVPDRFRGWSRRRMEERAAERAAERALRDLAPATPILRTLVENSEAILRWVRNGAADLPQTVARIEEEVGEVKRTLNAHIELQIDGPKGPRDPA